MEELDIIEERDGYRVRLQRDVDASKPEEAGQCPILQVWMKPYTGYGALAFNDAAQGFGRIFNKISARFSNDGPSKVVYIFERYLRIFHGTKSFNTYHLGYSREYGYIAFDTKAWLEEIGVTGENSDIEPVDRASLDEVISWATGDVWGYIVEKEVFWTKQYHDADGEPVTEKDENLPSLDAEGESGSDWFEVQDGSCWGLYGREWAEQAAKEALNEETVYAGLGDGSED